MDVLEMFRVAPNRIQPSDSCAKLILDAEIECRAFMSATNQLFGEGAARTAGSLWVEELEASSKPFPRPRFALADRDDIRRKPTCRSDESNPLDGEDSLWRRRAAAPLQSAREKPALCPPVEI